MTRTSNLHDDGAPMAEPYGWDDPREKPETGLERGRGLLRHPNEEPPSPRILKLALIAAGIIIVIALILYFKARKAPPALRNNLRATPVFLNARHVWRDAESGGKS